MDTRCAYRNSHANRRSLIQVIDIILAIKSTTKVIVKPLWENFAEYPLRCFMLDII